MIAVLELDGVGRRYQRTWRSAPLDALADVSMALFAGTITAVVGRSGAGKSTLARLMLGLEPPDQGSVRFQGLDLALLGGRDRLAVRRRMHLVLQDPYASLHPAMRIRDVVGEPLLIARQPRRERIERVRAALESVGLVPVERFIDRFAHELSGGQRQRVALARATVGRPELIVADEPTSMLDVSVRAGVMQVIRSVRDDTGAAIVMITHDIALARSIADHIVVLTNGRVVEQGPRDRVLDQPEHNETLALLEASRDIRRPPQSSAVHPCRSALTRF